MTKLKCLTCGASYSGTKLQAHDDGWRIKEAVVCPECADQTVTPLTLRLIELADMVRGSVTSSKFDGVLTIKIGTSYLYFNPKLSDRHNAIFTVWCREKLEEIRQEPHQFRNVDGEPTIRIQAGAFQGETYAEAWANALHAGMIAHEEKQLSKK